MKPPPSECEHEWVSAENEVVKGGLICRKCFALTPERGETRAPADTWDAREIELNRLRARVAALEKVVVDVCDEFRASDDGSALFGAEECLRRIRALTEGKRDE
jgi:hypothetical protein